MYKKIKYRKTGAPVGNKSILSYIYFINVWDKMFFVYIG